MVVWACSNEGAPPQLSMRSGTNPFRRAQVPPNTSISTPVTAPHIQPIGLDLTPLRAHYLKKTLVSLQLEEELKAIHRPDVLELLGPPFRSSKRIQNDELPLFRHILHQFVLTFPFFQSASPDFFSNKVQLFVERMLERNLIVLDEFDNSHHSSSMVQKTKAYLTMLLSSGLHAQGVEEDIVRICENDRQRLSSLDARRHAAQDPGHAFTTKVNIVCVRRTLSRGRIRHKTLDDFIIATHLNNDEIYVARRYKDFRQLHQQLRALFPTEDLPDLPPKDMSSTEVQGSLQPDSNEEWTDLTAVTPNSLVRETNRLTLRAFLRSILAVPSVADSEIFQEFLTGDPTFLTSEDKADVEIRRRADAVRESQHREFADKMAERVRDLQLHLDSFKSMLKQPDGLSHVFSTIRECAHVDELPPEYKVLVDWATVSMASGLFSMFVGRDSSSRAFAHLKYMHSMMPYFVIRNILRISNPVAMLRSFLDLFLAQPFGQKSLLQRMYTGKLTEELNEIKDLSATVRAKIPDPLYARKVQEFVTLPYDMQCLFHEQANAEKNDILTVLLRSPLTAELNTQQMEQVNRANIAYRRLRRQRAHAHSLGVPEPEPNSDDAWLLEDLHVYLNLCSAMHIKEQLIGLIYDHATTDLLKDMVTIFYAPLAQVYRVANISDTLGEIQVFISDLIKTVDDHTALQASNPDAMVSAFVNLVQRHQQTFYHFVHQVHSKGSDLFQRLIRWVELFVNYVRDPREPESCGLGWINLEQCLTDSRVDRARVMAEVDEVIRFVYHRKLQREIKRRRKMARKVVSGAADTPQEEQAFMNTMTEQFGFGTGLQDEIEELDKSESESESTDSSDDDSGPEDADASAIRRERVAHARTTPSTPDFYSSEPSTPTIRAMLPTLQRVLRDKINSRTNPI